MIPGYFDRLSINLSRGPKRGILRFFAPEADGSDQARGGELSITPYGTTRGGQHDVDAGLFGAREGLD